MGEETRPPVGRTSIVKMLVVGLIASLIGIAIGLAIDWFPVQGSTQAEKIDTLWDVLIVSSVPIFVLVTVIVLFSVLEFRQRRGEELADGPPIHGNTRIEVIWTALPAILLVTLSTYAYVVLTDIEEAPANPQAERRITVTGQQFAWTFTYPKAGPGGKDLTVTRLYLPVGQSVRFDVRTKDVLHDFWVPQFRMKIDAVPGMTTSYRVTPTKLGRFTAVCAELCGLGHAYMRQSVTVLPQDKFDAWLRKQAQPPDKTAASSAAPGDQARFGAAIVDPGTPVAEGRPPNVMPIDYGDVLSPQELPAPVRYPKETIQ